MHISLRASACIILFASTLFALEVPLTVKETSGVNRSINPVNSGVPLPQGAVKEVGALRLMDSNGKVVCASIEPRSRWLNDNSLKWVTVHFVTDLAANASSNYKLVTSDLPLPPSQLQIVKSDKAITVTTGPAKFVIATDKLAPFSQVYLRKDAGRDFTENDALLQRPATAVLAARNGTSRVVPRTDEHKDEFRTELVRIDDQSFTQNATVQKAEIEEQGPGRAVIALKGTFSTPENKSLDFTARLYFYIGSPRAEMTYSVRNRQLNSMADFVAIERLAIELPLKVAGTPARLWGKDNRSETATATRIAQIDMDNLIIGDSDRTPGKFDGWVRLSSDACTFTAGTRWGWQVYPLGAVIQPDGMVMMELKPATGKRIDLYTAGAKTHFLFFNFAPDAAIAPQSISAGSTDPLFAVCDPNWYCQETRVFGDLYANNPALFKPQYRDAIAKYQANLDRCLKQIVEQRPRKGWKVDEFGWLNFGSGLHHSSCVREDDHESWWDSNYYDFPHAVLVNFLRTGDLLNLTTAVEAGLHLADLDICHSFPGYPDRAGSPRSGPVVGHFRNYTRGQEFMGHDSFTFYKNESLYELYYLTGEQWYHEVAIMSSDFAMAFWGRGALRNVAHGIWGVLSAYQDTHDKKYLDRATFFVNEWAKPWQDKFNGSFNDQLWMYGLQFEAYDKFFRITGDKDTAKYCLKALDCAIAEEDDPKRKLPGGARDGMCLAGYGYAYDYTGNPKYLEQGVKIFENTSKASGNRVKTFAQQFRSTPYFLTVLTEGYKPSAPLAQP